MKNKRTIISILTILCLLMLQGCGAAMTGSENESVDKPAEEVSGELSPEDTELVLTLEELAQYNGKNGNPAYIAVDGIIYDVTDVPQWKNGDHNGFEAGQELTDAIKNVSPHGVSKLKSIPVRGKLVD